jgi:hypothetical protein
MRQGGYWACFKMRTDPSAPIDERRHNGCRSATPTNRLNLSHKPTFSRCAMAPERRGFTQACEEIPNAS